MSRLITLKQIYDEIISRVTSSKEEWKAFLSFASGIYKYSFGNALLIYAQRPDATVVADMPTWNRKVGRYINKGAKSIAVFDTDEPVLKLCYLFDIKDTNGILDNIPVIWRLNAETAVMLIDKLNEKNGFFEGSLDEHIVYMAELVAEAAFEEYTRDIENDIKGSWLESLPCDGITAFIHEEALKTKLTRLFELNTLLDLDKKEVVIGDDAIEKNNEDSKNFDAAEEEEYEEMAV